MDLRDIKISDTIRGPDGKEVQVVGIDYQGTLKKRGPLIILHDRRDLDMKELEEFQPCTDSCAKMSN